MATRVNQVGGKHGTGSGASAASMPPISPSGDVGGSQKTAELPKISPEQEVTYINSFFENLRNSLKREIFTTFRNALTPEELQKIEDGTKKLPASIKNNNAVKELLAKRNITSWENAEALFFTTQREYKIFLNDALSEKGLPADLLALEERANHAARSTEQASKAVEAAVEQNVTVSIAPDFSRAIVKLEGKEEGQAGKIALIGGAAVALGALALVGILFKHRQHVQQQINQPTSEQASVTR